MPGSHIGGKPLPGGTGRRRAFKVHIDAVKNHTKKNAEIKSDPSLYRPSWAMFGSEHSCGWP
jgi:hypothetical protein